MVVLLVVVVLLPDALADACDLAALPLPPALGTLCCHCRLHREICATWPC